ASHAARSGSAAAPPLAASGAPQPASAPATTSAAESSIAVCMTPPFQPARKYAKPPSLIYSTQPCSVDGECDVPGGRRSHVPRANAPFASANEPPSTKSSAPLG